MRMNDRGAASILVLLLIIVLATFGAIALTTGYSNKNLVSRSVDYFKDYYKADAECEAMICAVDQNLMDAHIRALEYINQYYPLYGLPGGISPADVPESFRELINYNNDNSTILAKKVLEIYRRLYFCYAYQNLSVNASHSGYTVELSEKYASALDFLNSEYDVAQNECPIKIEFSGSSSMTRIDAEVGVLSPKISFVLENDINPRYNMRTVYGYGSSRYRIMSWIQHIPISGVGMEPMYDGKVE